MGRELLIGCGAARDKLLGQVHDYYFVLKSIKPSRYEQSPG